MGQDDVTLDLTPRFLWGLIGSTWYVVCMSVDTLMPYQDDQLKLRLWMDDDQLATFEKCRSFALHRVSGGRRGDKYRVDDICSMFNSGVETYRREGEGDDGDWTMVEVILTGQNVSHLLDSRNHPHDIVKVPSRGPGGQSRVKLAGAPDWLSEEDKAKFK